MNRQYKLFTNCPDLASVIIPGSVNSIGNYAFFSCSSLNSITCRAITPPSGGWYIFENTNNCPIYVPAGSVAAYKAAEYWQSYASRIFPIP